MTKNEIIKKLTYIVDQIETMSEMKADDCINSVMKEFEKFKTNPKKIDFGYVSYVSHLAEEAKHVEEVIKQIIRDEPWINQM